MDAGPAQFEDLASKSVEGGQVEELLAVVAEVALGAVAALHAVGSGQLISDGIVHHQVVADEIEAVAVQSCLGGGVQSLPQLAVENQITQPLALDNVFQRLGHANPETFRCGDGISAIVNQDSGFWHASSVKQGRLQACFRNVIYRFLEVTDELQRRYTWMRVMGRQPCRLKVSNPIYVEHAGNLYEIRDSHSMDGHFVRAFEAASKSQQKLVWSGWAARFAISEVERVLRTSF